MSFGNFLRRLSFDTEKQQGDPNETTEGTTSISSIFTAPGKLIESVNVKTGHLVSDLNQKLDLGGKLDSLKQVSVTKFENVWGSSGSKDEAGRTAEEKIFSSPSKTDSMTGTHTNPFERAPHATEQTTGSVGSSRESDERRDSQASSLLRRQSTNAGPRPPRPPPPTPAALSRALSVDQANIAMNYGKDAHLTKPHPMPGTLEEEEDRFGASCLPPHSKDEDADDASSASEYGAYGDKPVYEKDEPDSPALNTQQTEELHSKGAEEIEERGVSTNEVDSVMDICVPALVNGRLRFVKSNSNPLQNYFATSIGRTSFVHRIEQESVNTQGHLDPSALPALLDKISLLLNECEDAEDFVPAKKILTVSLLFYVTDPGSPGDRTFLFNYIKSQPIWQSLRFWNACFFQSVQEARAKLSEQPEVEKKPEKIACEQLKSYLDTMNVFDLHKTIKHEFLRKHSNLFNLTDEETQNLRSIIDGPAT
ncbi:hypothetical protein FGIG_08884 [Fasciola gigantica]|uniref:SBF1/SBF2 domain-containing protein n=1 Tax=Fasciola gigantica TaxID=46835 RepID=A0A504YFZ5_FASGI|nr:hypothetical protein FGIG_08884 [Fasciola gigantica]